MFRCPDDLSLHFSARFFGEVAFIFWLVIKGAKPPALDAAASSSASG